MSYVHEQQRISQSVDHQDRQGTKTSILFFLNISVLFFSLVYCQYFPVKSPNFYGDMIINKPVN